MGSPACPRLPSTSKSALLSSVPEPAQAAARVSATLGECPRHWASVADSDRAGVPDTGCMTASLSATLAGMLTVFATVSAHRRGHSVECPRHGASDGDTRLTVADTQSSVRDASEKYPVVLVKYWRCPGYFYLFPMRWINESSDVP